ncbi:MAG: tRNA pseudouridine(38-40) synthase TruA [Eubacteriales bacterium]|nr:tRNA pseudouridine(38-40) synthase TruA [Eubacteriales bacterium]
MINIALLTEYDGIGFHGWQSQKGLRNVQDELSGAIQKITGDRPVVTGCSRTDAGVHAKGHVSNFKSDIRVPVNKIPIALNSKLPDDISVLKALEVSDSFHARFDAVGKEYRYRIIFGQSRPSLDRNRAYHSNFELDVSSMQKATGSLVGTHDFKAFMASGSEVKTTIRTIYALDVVSVENGVDILVKGDGFLYNMVRIIAGTLFYVGNGRFRAEDVSGMIESGDRRNTGKTLPAYGLYLEKVFYSDGLFGYNI